jgi:hypothetical protein
MPTPPAIHFVPVVVETEKARRLAGVNRDIPSDLRRSLVQPEPIPERSEPHQRGCWRRRWLANGGKRCVGHLCAALQVKRVQSW